MMRTPRRRASRHTSSRLAPAATGSLNALPIEPRRAFHPNGSADPAVTTTPVAPAASAERMMAPTLPGSCTSTAHTTSAGCASSTRSGSAGCHRATATMPEGVLTGLAASITAGLAA